MTDGLEIPGDLGWITLLVILMAIAWRVGVLKGSAALRAVVAGAGAALLAVPVMAWLTSAYSLPNPVWAVVYYGPVVTVVLLVWIRGHTQTGIPTRDAILP